MQIKKEERQDLKNEEVHLINQFRNEMGNVYKKENQRKIKQEESLSGNSMNLEQEQDEQQEKQKLEQIQTTLNRLIKKNKNQIQQFELMERHYVQQDLIPDECRFIPGIENSIREVIAGKEEQRQKYSNFTQNEELCYYEKKFKEDFYKQLTFEYQDRLKLDNNTKWMKGQLSKIGQILNREQEMNLELLWFNTATLLAGRFLRESDCETLKIEERVMAKQYFFKMIYLIIQVETSEFRLLFQRAFE